MRTFSQSHNISALGRRLWRHGAFTTAALALLTLVAACDNFSDPVAPGEPTLVFEAALEPLGAEVHVVAIPNAGVSTISLDRLEAQQVNDTFNDSGFGVTIRLARLDNNCEEGAAFSLQEGQRVVFDLVETSYCLNVSEAGLIPEGALLAYSIGVTLP